MGLSLFYIHSELLAQKRLLILLPF